MKRIHRARFLSVIHGFESCASQRGVTYEIVSESELIKINFSILLNKSCG
jgi:hypothetical protein